MTSIHEQFRLKREILSLVDMNMFAEAKAIAIQLHDVLPSDIEVTWCLAQLQARTDELLMAVDNYILVASASILLREEALNRAFDICYGHDFFEKGLYLFAIFEESGFVTPDKLYKVGRIHAGRFCFTTAISFFERALAETDDQNLIDQIKLQLGRGLFYLGDLEGAIRIFREQSDGNPDNRHPYYLEITSTNYSDSLSDELIFQTHLKFTRLLEKKYKPSFDSGPCFDEGRKLRVGFVSPDFYQHSVSHFFRNIIENIDKNRFHISCYSDVLNPDTVTHDIRQHANMWVNCLGLSDQELLEQMRGDRIDILIDLTGYMGESRLTVFAKRAAPIQITYLGYPNTTGLREMDYRLTDEWCDPAGQTEKYHTETLYRLPKGFLTYKPTSDAPEVSPLPALDHPDQTITFGSLNIFQKISPTNLRLWAAILNEIPNSRLLIKSKQFVDESLQDNIYTKFKEYGIDADRIKTFAWIAGQNNHLKFFDSLDVCLDTFPYCGTTTTCEALWQGVPTLTLVGKTHRSRVGLSLLSQAGLEKFIAKDERHFIELAKGISEDLTALQSTRQSLRETLSKTELFDGKKFCQQFELALLTMARRAS